MDSAFTSTAISLNDALHQEFREKVFVVLLPNHPEKIHEILDPFRVTVEVVNRDSALKHGPADL